MSNGYWKDITANLLLKEFGNIQTNSLEICNIFCKKLNAEQLSKNGFAERVFRTGTFKGYNYNYKDAPNNKYLNSSLFDHQYYFKTKKDNNSKRKIYLVSQPYLNDKECMELWQKYLEEEARIMGYVPKDYQRPILDCLILGKDKSFYNPNNTNIIIIGNIEDIASIRY